jgi:hypothetical protein
VQRPSESSSVLYEVTLEADAAIAAPFDTWLRDHIADMLQFDGFRSAEILDDAAPPPGRIRRIVQYRLRDRAALDDYLAFHAPRMQTQGIGRFGDRATEVARVLPHREEFVRGAVSTENCLNCGEVLTGQHCSHCGQHAKVRVLSLWGLIKDVIGDLLDADSRVWRTLVPLAFRPGLLTQEFLRGRRARYTPPFRMYLVLSLVFFVVASLSDPGGDVALQIDDEGANIQLRDGGAEGAAASASGGEGAGAEPAAADAAKAAKATTTGAAEPGTPRELDESERRLIDQIVRRLPAAEREALRKEMETTLTQATPAERAATAKVLADPCSEDTLKFDAGPVLERYEPRLREACRKIVADQQSFGRAMFENVPKMMFIFLPLIAGAMSVLYLRSGRYYVEHLLFVVHFHAFFFLAGIVVILLDRFAEMLSGGAAEAVTVAQGFLGAALMFYVPWYLLKAMRRVYEQSWWKTMPKFVLLGLAYLFSLVFTLLGLLFYTALSL